MTARQLGTVPFSVAPFTRSTSSAWSAEDLLRWLVVLVIGVSMVLGAWYVASGQAALGRQVPAVDLAIAGAIVTVSGNAVWLLKGRRRVGQRTNASSLRAGLLLRTTGQPAIADSRAQADELQWVPGLRYFHKETCVLLKARDSEVAPRDEHELAGRYPCPICRP